MVLGCDIYQGENKLDYWQRTLNPYAAQLRDPSTQRSIRQMKRTALDVDKLTSEFIEAEYYEQVFGLVGASAAASIYMLSYPITWVDGPLPLVDAAWLAGLFRVTRSGYEVGEFIGSFFS